MYIDVLEFNNRHFASSFHNVPEQFKWRMEAELSEVSANPAWCGIDPGFVLATIYLQILTYFLVERLFGGNQHLGVSDDTAIRRIIDLVLNGLWRSDQGGQPTPAGSSAAKKKSAQTNAAKRKTRPNKLNKPNRVAARNKASK
jgi:hypothetical protein